MNIKKTTLATAVTAVLAMGAAGQAVAYEYAISSLYITSLNVILSDNGGTTPGGGLPTSFEFTQTNTAFLNTDGGGSTATCSGTFGGSNTCTATNLNATVVNGDLSDIVQGENTFTVNGPGSGSSYSNGDSVIYSASLLGGATTSTRQQAEAEINPGDDSASASTEVGSTTGFSMTFNLVGANQMEVNMTALLKILAEINDPTASGATVKANTEVEFKLSQDGTNNFFTFRPDGAGTNECLAVGTGLTCTTLADEFDLNTDINITGVPNSIAGRSNTAADDYFRVLFAGLTDGIWTLGLNAKTSVNMSRTAAVPEPGILALMGIGLLGLGMSARRRKIALTS